MDVHRQEHGKSGVAIDADGVALAAIQALQHLLEEREQQISQMEMRVRSLRERLSDPGITVMSQSSLLPGAGALVLVGLLGAAMRRRSRWTALLFLCVLPSLARATTFHVAPGLVEINDSDGKCSLTEAIINARENRQLHIDCPRGTSDDIIELSPASTYTITTPYEFNRGLPNIFGRTVVEGNGSVIERADAAPSFVILTFGSGGFGISVPMTVRNLTIRNGRIGIFNASFASSLTLINCTIKECHNIGESGGGGIQTFGSLTVIDSTFTDNSGGPGAAIWAPIGAPPITIINSTFSHNTLDPSLCGVPCDPFAAFPATARPLAASES